MLSMPMNNDEDGGSERTTTEEEIISPDPTEYMGIVEEKLSMIIYGNSNPLNPSRDS